jgi:thiol-disulfide isomerase/thioredoxin
MPPILLTLLTRRDCCLCEDMETVIGEVAADVPFEIETVDVDTDPELRARYGDAVPVLLVNGRMAFKYRVTAAALRSRLRAEERRQGSSIWRRFLTRSR